MDFVTSSGLVVTLLFLVGIMTSQKERKAKRCINRKRLTSEHRTNVEYYLISGINNRKPNFNSPHQLMLDRSDYFILASALISLVLSIFLWFGANKDAGLFVGIWVPSLLSLGSYLKVITKEKNHG